MSLSLDQARDQQALEKREFVWAVRLALATALLRRQPDGSPALVHADDIDVDLPDEHKNILGSQCATFVRRGWMVESFRRASTRTAANGRKSGVFQITELGRQTLVGVGGGRSAAGSTGGSRGNTSPDPGQNRSAGDGPPPSVSRGARPDPAPGEATDLNPAHGLPTSPHYAPVTDPAALDQREADWAHKLNAEIAAGEMRWCDGSGPQQIELEAA